MAAKAQDIVLDLPAGAIDISPDGRVRYNDFSSEIELMQERYKEARQALSNARDQDMAMLAAGRTDQYYRAVINFREAEYIEPRLTQFGTHRSKKLKIRVPPSTDEFYNNDRHLLRGHNYTVRTDDPIQIAHLRKIVADRTIIDFVEMEPGLVPVFLQGYDFLGWEPSDKALRIIDMGAARPW